MKSEWGIAKIIFFLFVLISFGGYPHSVESAVSSIQTDEFIVSFEEQIDSFARELVGIFPSVSKDLSDILGWPVTFRPQIVLINQTDIFRSMVHSDLMVAFAVSSRNLIVLDTTRIYTKPFTLESTLKHELCHLLLHHNIAQERIPRWLDEGVCQWVSGGIAELMSAEEGKTLSKAVVSESLIPIHELGRFPHDGKPLILAYEESKDFIEYLVSEFGSQKLLQVLNSVKKGHPFEEAFRESYSMSLDELEMKWHGSLKRKHTWFSYVSNNLYTILFFITSLITVYAFLKMLQKKKRQVAEDEDVDEKEDDRRV
jgi:hypothetical protein